MPKYKISKSNLKEFFGWFNKKNKPKDLQTLIDNDPELQKLEKDLKDLQKKTVTKLSPEQEKIWKKYGII